MAIALAREWRALHAFALDPPPIIVRAILTGTIVATAGTIPWALLVSANSKHVPAIPGVITITGIADHDPSELVIRMG